MKMIIKARCGHRVVVYHHGAVVDNCNACHEVKEKITLPSENKNIIHDVLSERSKQLLRDEFDE